MNNYEILGILFTTEAVAHDLVQKTTRVTIQHKKTQHEKTQVQHETTQV